MWNNAARPLSTAELEIILSNVGSLRWWAAASASKYHRTALLRRQSSGSRQNIIVDGQCRAHRRRIRDQIYDVNVGKAFLPLV
jgi:hypothetical protein